MSSAPGTGTTVAMSQPARHRARRAHPVIEGVVLGLMMAIFRPELDD